MDFDTANLQLPTEHVGAVHGAGDAAGRGLTLVHFSAELDRILWDRGGFGDCLGGV